MTKETTIGELAQNFREWMLLGEFNIGQYSKAKGYTIGKRGKIMCWYLDPCRYGGYRAYVPKLNNKGKTEYLYSRYLKSNHLIVIHYTKPE